MSDLNDGQLVLGYLKGDDESLVVLIKRYLKPIYNFICRYVRNGAEAEDIAQEVFLRVWKNIKKFDREKKFKTWIFSIAKNAALDFIKKKKAMPFSDFSSKGGSAFGGTDEEGENIIENSIADTELLPSEVLERADIARILNEALEKLSPKYRAVLFLYYNENFNFREIAEILGEPIDTVKSRQRRALIMLKKLLS